jgi:hypothetical protein
MMFRRVGLYLPLLCLLVALGVLSLCCEAEADDTSGWQRCRTIQIPQELPDGFVAVALESSVLEKCRPDAGDLRIVSSTNSFVPFTLEDGKSVEGSATIPVRVFRITKAPGKFTDVWIDKTTKFLSGGVLVQTSSKDFVRKVEIRGSDDGRQSYVIRMDGLLADVLKPLAFSTLDLTHPLNNFQYIHLRITDGDLPPLKIDGVLCYPPAAESALAKPIDMRIMENRPDPAGSTAVMGDLGEKRFPLTRLTLSTQEKEFVKKAEVFAASSSSAETWKKVAESIVFRLHREDATKEKLEVPVPAEVSRYVKLVISGGGRATALSNVQASATVPVAVFEYHRGTEYRLLYGNPKASASAAKPLNADVSRVLPSASILHTGEERKNTVSAPPVPVGQPEKTKTTAPKWAMVFGVAMLLVGVLLLFGLMLKIRASRRARRSRFYRTKIHY